MPLLYLLILILPAAIIFIAPLRTKVWLPGAPTHPMTFIEGVMNLTGRRRRGCRIETDRR